MAYYDEVEIEDMVFDSEQKLYIYPCPCGDKFYISLVNFLFLFIFILKFAQLLTYSIQLINFIT